MPGDLPQNFSENRGVNRGLCTYSNEYGILKQAYTFMSKICTGMG